MIPVTTKEKITAYTKELRLPAIRQNYHTHAQEAVKAKHSYEDYLLTLVEDEFHTRLKNRKAARIRQAGFPYKKYLQDLKAEELPKEGQEKIGSIETLEFISSGQNIILAGNPGTGNVKHMIM